MFGKRIGSTFVQLVLSNRPCLLCEFATDNTAVRKHQFSEGNPAEQVDGTKFSERKPFGKFGAVEPPFAVFSVAY